MLEDIVHKYPSQNVGAGNHNELWVPSEELEAFNQAIVGNIKVIRVFIGSDFKKSADDKIEKMIAKLN